jgi:uncharacterized protein YkwD
MTTARSRLSALAALALAACASPPAPAAHMPAPDELIAEINRLRADPPAYAARLAAYRAYYDGRIVHEPGERIGLETREGTAAVDEAIGALRGQPPLGPLATDPALEQAATDHAREQGPRGLTGHRGRDGSDAAVRVARHGLRPNVVGEVISYGPRTASAVVREFLIDDGVRDRGHRQSLLSPLFTRAGAACGPHKGFGTMCVVVFAGAGEMRR